MCRAFSVIEVGEMIRAWMSGVRPVQGGGDADAVVLTAAIVCPAALANSRF